MPRTKLMCMKNSVHTCPKTYLPKIMYVLEQGQARGLGVISPVKMTNSGRAIMHSIYMACKPASICWCFVVSFKHSNKYFKQVVMQFFHVSPNFQFQLHNNLHAIRNQHKLQFLFPRKFKSLPSVKDLPHLNCVQRTMAKVQLARTSHKKSVKNSAIV